MNQNFFTTRRYENVDDLFLSMIWGDDPEERTGDRESLREQLELLGINLTIPNDPTWETIMKLYGEFLSTIPESEREKLEKKQEMTIQKRMGEISSMDFR